MNKTSDTLLPNATEDETASHARVAGIRSESLFGSSRQLQILHQGETYTLRITSRGKLILTK